jgi:hypothetical protein
MNMRTRIAWPLMLTMVLGLTGAAAGQSAMQKLFDNLAGRNNPSLPSPPSAATVRESEAHLMEILVELAWIGDPITFPFYLEARVEGSSLQVRGNVPMPAIRQHALKLAQLNTPLPVVDRLQENPRLATRPTRMSPEQLQKVVGAALRESLPGTAKKLQTRCTADGEVAVKGDVDSFERKLAVSRTLRRLHGCTVVINLTRVAYDLDGKLADNVRHPTAQTVSITTRVPPPTGAALPDISDWAKYSSSGNPASPPDKTPVIVMSPAIESVSAPNVIPVVPVTPVSPVAQLSPAQIQKRIKDACPKAREVRVSPEANGNIRVEIQVRDEADCEVVFRQIFAVPELAACPLQPSFIVANAGKN